MLAFVVHACTHIMHACCHAWDSKTPSMWETRAERWAGVSDSLGSHWRCLACAAAAILRLGPRRRICATMDASYARACLCFATFKVLRTCRLAIKLLRTFRLAIPACWFSVLGSWNLPPPTQSITAGFSFFFDSMFARTLCMHVGIVTIF